MTIFSILVWLGPLISAGLFYGIYRKTGLRGGILVVAFLPVLGLGLARLATFGLLGAVFDNTVVFFAISSLVSAICGLIPLVVLLMVDWPGRGQDEVLK